MSEELREEMQALRREVAQLNGHRILKVYNSWPRMMFSSFVRGLMVGLGTVIGATLLLSVLVWSLSQIEFIPIIGDWARQIAEIVAAG